MKTMMKRPLVKDCMVCLREVEAAEGVDAVEEEVEVPKEVCLMGVLKIQKESKDCKMS